MMKSNKTGRHSVKTAEDGQKPAGKPAERTGETSEYDELRRRKRHISFAVFTGAAAIIVVAMALILMGGAENKEYEAYLQKAIDSIATGDYDSALSDLRKAAAIDDNPDCALLMADCYEAQQNYEKAIEILGRAEQTEEVASRLTAVTRARESVLAADKIGIAGRMLLPDAATIVLDGAELTEEMLEQLAGFKNLDNLSLINTKLTGIAPLGKLNGLASLNLNDNQISDVSPLAELIGLRTLYLDGNPVEDFSPLCALTKLSVLSIRGTGISNEQLELLAEALPNCAIYSDNSGGDAVEITLGGVSFLSNVKELNLSGRGIQDISSLDMCRELVRLDLSDNEISDLRPLMNLPALEKLNVSGNRLLDLKPLIGISSLRSVKAANNEISSTATVGVMSALTELDLSGNPISDFSGLKKLRNLQRLYLNETNIDDEALQYLEYLTALTRLELDGNGGISGETMDKLKKTLWSCVVYHDKLVYSVEINGNMYKTDSTELDFTAAGLKEISRLGSFSCIETLRLAGNDITNIYILKYTASRDTIKTLDLSCNSISDINPISVLTAVETLDLSNNNISDLRALMNLGSLKSLRLNGNPLTEDQVEQLRNTLTGCNIEF